jgi:hypothetical protein
LHLAQRQQDPLELPLMAIIQQRPADDGMQIVQRARLKRPLSFGAGPEFWSVRVSSTRDTLRAVQSRSRRIRKVDGLPESILSHACVFTSARQLDRKWRFFPLAGDGAPRRATVRDAGLTTSGAVSKSRDSPGAPKDPGVFSSDELH